MIIITCNYLMTELWATLMKPPRNQRETTSVSEHNLEGTANQQLGSRLSTPFLRGTVPRCRRCLSASAFLHTFRPSPRCSAAPHNDVVDGDEDQLHCVANEAHDGEANGTSDGNLLEPWRLWTLVGSCGLWLRMIDHFKKFKQLDSLRLLNRLNRGQWILSLRHPLKPQECSMEGVAPPWSMKSVDAPLETSGRLRHLQSPTTSKVD